MDIVIRPTIDDGTIRASAILQTPRDLHHALSMPSSQLHEVACLTLVQTSIGVRTLRAVLDVLAQYPDAGARMAALVEQSQDCGLLAVSAGLRIASRSQ